MAGLSCDEQNLAIRRRGSNCRAREKQQGSSYTRCHCVAPTRFYRDGQPWAGTANDEAKLAGNVRACRGCGPDSGGGLARPGTKTLRDGADKRQDRSENGKCRIHDNCKLSTELEESDSNMRGNWAF